MAKTKYLSGGAAVKTSTILMWKSLQGSGTVQKPLSVNTVLCCIHKYKANLLQSLGLTNQNVKILFGNHGWCVLLAKEQREHPAYYQCTVQKPPSDGWEKHFTFKTTAIGLLSLKTLRVLLKEEVMQRSGKHALTWL